MIDPLIQSLLNLQRTSSQTLIQTLARRQDIKLNEVEKQPLVFAHWMSLILISSPQIKITFKVHYMLDTAKTLAAKIYSTNQEGVSLEKATDFFREFCSLVSGDLKIALVKSGVNTTVSLPILSKGFDDVFFPRPAGSFVSGWALRGTGVEFFCTTQFEIYQKIAFAGQDDDYEKQKGEVEFFKE